MNLRRWFLAPSWFWLVALFAAPFTIVLAYSFLSRGPYGGVEQPATLENYARLLDPLYLTILLRSFVIAAIATALCLVVAFPAALFIARSTKRRNLYLQLVMLPFWTSFLVRTYAWIFLLRETGLVNSALQALGLIREPLPLLYNNGAVLLGLVYGYFMDQRGWVRGLIVASAIPVAILANGARVAGTGMAAHWIGKEAAEGFFHEFSGWIVFLFAFVMILAIQKLIVKVAPKPAGALPPSTSPAAV